MAIELKDYLTIGISLAAFGFAIASFFANFRQRDLENRRTLRKTLTDIIAEISKVNIAHAQLDLEHPGSTRPHVIAMRRNFNGQRRYLAYHGEFIAEQIPGLTNDIDFVAIATAFDSAGDFERAKRYFNQAVEKSPSNTLRATNLRALARFSFMQGQAGQGRKYYETSLQQELPDTDSSRRFIADTLLIWACVERDTGFTSESLLIKDRAISTSGRIGNPAAREDMMKTINEALPPALLPNG